MQLAVDLILLDTTDAAEFAAQTLCWETFVPTQ